MGLGFEFVREKIFVLKVVSRSYNIDDIFREWKLFFSIQFNSSKNSIPKYLIRVYKFLAPLDPRKICNNSFNLFSLSPWENALAISVVLNELILDQLINI